MTFVSWLVLSAAAATPLQEDWIDTHRVHLRNGNYIEGRIELITEDHILIRWNSTALTKIRVMDIRADGIEEIKIRQVGVRPKIVRTSSDRPSDGADKPPDGAVATPPPAGMSEVIDPILSAILRASESQRAGLVGKIRAQGVDGARYIVSIIPKLDDARAGLAMAILAQLHDLKIEPELRSLLRAGKGFVRQDACVILAGRKDSGAVPSLMPLLRDGDAGVRAAAVEAVGQCADRSRLGDLVHAIRDPDARVRSKAIYFSNAVATREGIEEDLARRWQSELIQAQPEAKGELALAYGKLAGMAPKPEVPSGDMVRDLSSLLTDRLEVVRAGAVRGLGETREHGRAAVPELLTALDVERTPAVEAAICESLGKLGATESVDALITRLETGTDAVKDAAVRALRNITRQPFDADPVKWKEWRSGAHQ